MQSDADPQPSPPDGSPASEVPVASVANDAPPAASTSTEPLAQEAFHGGAADEGAERSVLESPPPPAFPAPSHLTPPADPAAGAPAAAAPAAPRVPASTALLVVVTVVSLAADLVTKGWAKARLSGVDPRAHGLKKIEVIKGHVDFIFAQNPGGAWSFLRGLPDSLRRPFFLVVSAAAIVFIITIYQRIHRDQTAMKWGLPLALGGAMGNLADRIRYGWVVDFIDFSARWGGREHHWPTFNVADIAIVVGVGLMAIDMLRARGLTPHEGHGPLPEPIP